MKKLIFATALIALVYTTFAQVPAAFNYQAIARTSSGELLVQQELTVRVGILQNDELIWQEDHIVTTNLYGHFSLMVGDAANGSGNAGSFENIDWGSGSYMVNLKVNDGTDFSDLGNTELLSVPFALYAAGGTDSDPNNELVTDLYLSGYTLHLKESKNEHAVDLTPLAGGTLQGPWRVEGNSVSLEEGFNLGVGSNVAPGKFVVMGFEHPDEEPLIEIRNNKGKPVLSGYNNGTFINVESGGVKGVKGGFAVGGYNSFKAEDDVQEYFRVTSDSIRVTINDAIQGKGVKGGFAVGGYNSGKADDKPYFYVERNSTLIQGMLAINGIAVEASDARFKTNIIEVENVLDQLMQLRGVYFDWNQLAKETLAATENRQIGVLAQEIEAVYPELVITNRDGYKMVDYSKFTSVLLQAIKEQQVQIEALQAKDQKITELEDRITQLEQLMNK
jgi:hypothetical protein